MCFGSGRRADYNDAWQEALYDSGDLHGVANICPTYGTLFGSALICKSTTPSGGGALGKRNERKPIKLSEGQRKARAF